jgi:hypothetical protein
LVRRREGDPSDDFASCAITSKEDFRELFLKPFFFGCEADDPVTASAFDAVRNPLSAHINAIYGSDIGHFDVPDMSEVTAEAFEPVEHGAMTEENFRDFVFCNPSSCGPHSTLTSSRARWLRVRSRATWQGRCDSRFQAIGKLRLNPN